MRAEMSIRYCPIYGQSTAVEICTGGENWQPRHEPIPTLDSPLGSWTTIDRPGSVED